MIDGDWLLELNKLESEYNKRRWNFRNKFKRFVRCNPYESGFSEIDLIKDLEEMHRVREEMKDLSHNHNFKHDRSHQIKLNDDIFSSRASKPVWIEYEE